MVKNTYKVIHFKRHLKEFKEIKMIVEFILSDNNTKITGTISQENGIYCVLKI